jgi:hypothetical protein
VPQRVCGHPREQEQPNTHQPVDLDAAPADVDDHDERSANLNAEAAAWRRKYSDQKAVSATQSALIERFQRTEISRLAADRLQDPEDLWRDVELAELVGEDGGVDPTLVGIQLDALVARKPHYARKVPPATPPASNVTADGRPARERAAGYLGHRAAGSSRSPP